MTSSNCSTSGSHSEMWQPEVRYNQSLTLGVGKLKCSSSGCGFVLPPCEAKPPCEIHWRSKAFGMTSTNSKKNYHCLSCMSNWNYYTDAMMFTTMEKAVGNMNCLPCEAALEKYLMAQKVPDDAISRIIPRRRNRQTNLIGAPELTNQPAPPPPPYKPPRPTVSPQPDSVELPEGVVIGIWRQPGAQPALPPTLPVREKCRIKKDYDGMEGYKELDQDGVIQRWSKTNFLNVHEGDVVTILCEDYYIGTLSDRFPLYAYCSKCVNNMTCKGYVPLNVLRFKDPNDAGVDTLYV